MTLPSLLMKYPLDLSGKAATNLVIGELHDVSGIKKGVFVPNGGPFYVKDLVVRNAATGETLVPTSQYLVLQPFSEAMELSGLEVCSVVFIKDPDVESVTIDYRVVGGEFSWTTYAIKELIETLDMDNRPVAWGDILGKPNAYPPTPHLHDLGDTYGWEYIAHQLEGIRTAILTGDAASHESIIEQLIQIGNSVDGNVELLRNQLTAHANDKTNPHVVTKAQVGLGLVENYPPATDAEADAGVSDTTVLTPRTGARLAGIMADRSVDTHVNDKSNPHDVGAAQVGLGSVQNYGIATRQDVIATLQNFEDIFNTWQRYSHLSNSMNAVPSELTAWSYVAETDTLACAVNSTSHLGFVSPDEYSDYDFQVSLSSLDNDDDIIGVVIGFEVIGGVEYSLVAYRHLSDQWGSSSFAVAYNQGMYGSRIVASNNGGLDTNPYLNSAGGTGWSTVKLGIRVVRNGDTITVYTTKPNESTWQSDNKLVIDLTAAPDLQKFMGSSRIGFYSFSQNKASWSLMSVPWARNDKYVTPLRVRDMLESAALEPLNAHRFDKTNPHQVTKAQVGLGSVDNYPTATKAEAELGDADNRFMTALRVKEAIAAQAGAGMAQHVASVSNPHNVTKAQVGLGSVENYGVATQAEAEAGVVSNKYMTPLRTKQAISIIAGVMIANHTALKNPHGTTASDVGAYSKTESDQLLNAKLNTTGTAANSSKLEGKTKSEVIAETLSAVGTMAFRNLHVYNRAPTAAEGANGDVWFQY